MSFMSEELTAAKARIRELEADLEIAQRTNATLRNILVTPHALGPELLAAPASSPMDPALRSWLAALPDAVECLPPVAGTRRAKGVLPS